MNEESQGPQDPKDQWVLRGRVDFKANRALQVSLDQRELELQVRQDLEELLVLEGPEEQ